MVGVRSTCMDNTTHKNMTKHIVSIIFVLYISLLPLWIFTATWEQIIIGYICYWFMVDIVSSKFYHHWAAHKLWNPPRWLQKILSIVGVGALIGTPIAWTAWHRTHHIHSDTEKDPHSPMFKSAFYIMFSHYHTAQIKRAVDRLRDNFLMTLAKNEIYIVIGINLGLFLLLDWSWFLTLWAIPVGCSIFSINYIVNILSHKNGKAENISSWWWFLVFADGITHGSHHNKPKLSYFKYDPSSWIINKLGWINEPRP